MSEHAAPGGGAGPGGRRAPWWIVVVLALAVVALAVALLVVDDDEDSGPSTTGSDTTETTASEPTSTETTALAVDRSTAVWPVEGSSVAYDDPVEAARGFAEDYLGFTSPIVGELMQGDSRSGEIEVRANEDGAVTLVLVRQLSGEDTWSVLAAIAEDIELTEPASGTAIASPVALEGRAMAFEGTVQVEVRDDATVDPIGKGFVTGGFAEMGPFDGSVDFAPPATEHGAIVLFTTSAEDGRVLSATVLRVAFAPQD